MQSFLLRWYHSLATSGGWGFRLLRSIRRAIRNFAVPAPRLLMLPVLGLFVAARAAYYFVLRVFIAEPLFKAYCTSYGRNLHTGKFVHWVQGRGNLIVGDNVYVEGKCAFSFAIRYTGEPTLLIGDYTQIGHDCKLIVGRRISIGKHCHIAAGVYMFDSPGHAMDPAARLSGAPAADEDVREIVIEDNVWIGARAIVYPGVRIGEGSVVATGAVVMNDVPAGSLVAGNPARRLKALV